MAKPVAAKVAELLAWVHERFVGAHLFYGHGTSNAWDEAVALVLTHAGLADTTENLNRVLPADTVVEIKDLAMRRINERLPLPYLLGRCRYMGFEFKVVPGVVVPRSPIGGLLVDGVRPWLQDRPAQILDLCAGTGCLGIIAAHMWPGAKVTLVEIDPLAATLARHNVEAHGFSDRVIVIEADVGSWRPDRAADLVITNPPYVQQMEMASLPEEYRAEPELGLAAGHDGLRVIEGILAAAQAFVSQQGLLIGEVGASAPALISCFQGVPFIWPDLPRGGEGVFLLEGGASSSHTARHD